MDILHLAFILFLVIFGCIAIKTVIRKLSGVKSQIHPEASIKEVPVGCNRKEWGRLDTTDLNTHPSRIRNAPKELDPLVADTIQKWGSDYLLEQNRKKSEENKKKQKELLTLDEDISNLRWFNGNDFFSNNSDVVKESQKPNTSHSYNDGYSCYTPDAPSSLSSSGSYSSSSSDCSSSSDSGSSCGSCGGD